MLWNKDKYPSLESNRYLLSVGWVLSLQGPNGEHSHTNFNPVLYGTTVVDAVYEIGRASCRERVCQYV